ncbi:MAG: hypothetical protein HQK54_15830 [Oligoflexales bacterium]|nr:hypothetical protein [Oligoflexales bacterium]
MAIKFSRKLVIIADVFTLILVAVSCSQGAGTSNLRTSGTQKSASSDSQKNSAGDAGDAGGAGSLNGIEKNKIESTQIEKNYINESSSKMADSGGVKTASISDQTATKEPDTPKVSNVSEDTSPAAPKNIAESGTVPTPTPRPTPTPTPTPTPATVFTKDFVEVKVKLGVNFEDGGIIGTDTDFDFNDAVLCFEGNFSLDVKTREVKALKDQTVVANYSRNADCQNHMLIEVIDPDGKKNGPIDVTTPSSSVEKMNLTFKMGSVLKVYLVAGSGCNNSGKVVPMTDTEYTEVAVDKCNI